MLDAQPLPKEFLERARKAGIKQIEVRFSGGSDEAYLDIGYLLYESETDEVLDQLGGLSGKNRHDLARELCKDVEAWADRAYPYSGAGEGTDYGDNILYDLETMTVETSDWHMERVDGESAQRSFGDLE